MSRNGDLNPIQDGDSKVFEYIEEWKSRLIDFSSRNRLLYFKHSRYENLTVSSPDAETVFSRLVNRKRSLEFWLPPEGQDKPQAKIEAISPNSPEHPKKPTINQIVCEGLTRKEMERILKKLRRRSLSDYRERGVRILYAAFGMLNWKEQATNEEIRSPLILVPIAPAPPAAPTW